MHLLHIRSAHVAAVLLLAQILIVPVASSAGAKDAPNIFDTPTEQRRIPLAPDPANTAAKAELSCFVYPGFMVKQIDRGEKGAAQLSMLPFSGASTPECKEANVSGEKVIEEKDWTGYFKGVKGSYVFFDADDGVNGGLGFAIYNGTSGAKLFDDSTSALHSIAITPSALTLRYARVYSAECSLVEHADQCWQTVVQATGVSQPRPDCATSYKEGQLASKITAEQMASDPSVLEYEVEATIGGDGAKIVPLPGKITCYPAE